MLVLAAEGATTAPSYGSGLLTLGGAGVAAAVAVWLDWRKAARERADKWTGGASSLLVGIWPS